MDNSLLWGCPVHCSMFGSIPGLFLLVPVAPPPQLCQPKIAPRHSQKSLGSKITQVEKHGLMDASPPALCHSCGRPTLWFLHVASPAHSLLPLIALCSASEVESCQQEGGISGE